MAKDTEERRIADLTVRIDRKRCIGSGNCTKVAPTVFELDAETIATFREGIGDVERNRVIEACEVCPVDALIVLDEAGKQIVPRPE